VLTHGLLTKVCYGMRVLSLAKEDTRKTSRRYSDSLSGSRKKYGHQKTYDNHPQRWSRSPQCLGFFWPSFWHDHLAGWVAARRLPWYSLLYWHTLRCSRYPHNSGGLVRCWQSSPWSLYLAGDIRTFSEVTRSAKRSRNTKAFKLLWHVLGVQRLIQKSFTTQTGLSNVFLSWTF